MLWLRLWQTVFATCLNFHFLWSVLAFVNKQHIWFNCKDVGIFCTHIVLISHLEFHLLVASSQYGADACIKHLWQQNMVTGMGLVILLISPCSCGQAVPTQKVRISSLNCFNCLKWTLTHIQSSFIDSVHKQINTETMHYGTFVANNTLIKPNNQFRISLWQLAWICNTWVL